MIGNPAAIIKWLVEQNPKEEFEIKKHRKRRSLNANAYAWSLISKIGLALNKPKEEVYVQMLKDYGQSEMITVTENVKLEKYIKYFEFAGESILNGQRAIHYRIFKGSSEMDTKEMSQLIDGIVQEAENLEIQTLRSEDIERLKKNWRNE